MINQKLKITNDEKQNLFFHISKFYYYISLAIGFLFKPLLLSKYYKSNFLPLFKLINRAFTKSVILTFLTFWYPFIFILIVANITSPQYTVFSIGVMIPTVVGIQILPILIVEFKRSSLLKKIGATKIETWMLTLSFILYFSLVAFISVLMNVGLGILINYKDMVFSGITLPGGIHINRVVNFAQYFFAILMALVISISVGMAIGGLVKTPPAASMCGLLIILIGGFLSGQFISFRIINNVQALKYIGFLFPQKWPTLLGVIATSGGNIFDFSSGGLAKTIDWQNLGVINTMHSQYGIPISDLLKSNPVISSIAIKNIMICTFIVPWIISTLAFLISVKWFKWK